MTQLRLVKLHSSSKMSDVSFLSEFCGRHSSALSAHCGPSKDLVYFPCKFFLLAMSMSSKITGNLFSCEREANSKENAKK